MKKPLEYSHKMILPLAVVLATFPLTGARASSQKGHGAQDLDTTIPKAVTDTAADANQRRLQRERLRQNEADRQLIQAVDFGDLADVKKAIFRNRADVNFMDDLGLTPLMHAAGIRKDDQVDRDIVRLLIATGADINMKAANGESALEIAVQQDRKDVVAEIANAINTLKATASLASLETSHLLKDVDADSLAEIKKDLEGDADPNVRDSEGRTALMHVAGRRKAGPADIKIIEILVESGADINATDAAGDSVLKIANRNGRTDISALLVRFGAK